MTEFTFGKYLGQTVADVAMVNPGYLTWLTDQPQMREKHPRIFEAIDALNGGASTTPIHNQLQAAFSIDTEFTINALSSLTTAIGKEHVDNAEKYVEKLKGVAEISKTDDSVLVFGTTSRGTTQLRPMTITEALGGGSSHFDVETEKYSTTTYCSDSKDYYSDTDTLHGIKVKSVSEIRSFVTDVGTSVEVLSLEKFCDVEIQLNYTVKVYFDYSGRDIHRETVTSIRYGRPGEPYPRETTDTDPEIYMSKGMHCRHMEDFGFQKKVAIEIKPTVGDEYPSIMRQMSGQLKMAGTPADSRKSFRYPWDIQVLYTRNNVSSLPDRVLIQMFAKNDIFMIIDRDTPLPDMGE